MKLVVGLVGRIGSGKTSVSEHLHLKYGASQYRFSQILVDILERLHLPPKREYLQTLGTVLREELDQNAIVYALEKDLEKDPADIIVIDGIRYENEVEMLRKFENNVMIFIDSPVKDRYKRCIMREKSKMSFAEFLEIEMKETERYIDVIGRKAEYVIKNTGTLQELLEKVDKIMEEIKP
jgi:dephospho-CoA kinase